MLCWWSKIQKDCWLIEQGAKIPLNEWILIEKKGRSESVVRGNRIREGIG